NPTSIVDHQHLSKGRDAYLAYIFEGIGDLQDWEAAMKFQRMNGSLFNSPSATAAALIHLRGDAGSLRYLRSVVGTSDGNNVPGNSTLFLVGDDRNWNGGGEHGLGN
ncbi:Ent-kaur-16-ene synthase, chloroplastic, partial [Linum perenne]